MTAHGALARTGHGGKRRRLVGVTRLSAADYHTTATPGGEPGAKPFCAAITFRLEFLTSAVRVFIGRRQDASPSYGWLLYYLTGNVLQAYIHASPTGTAMSAQYPLTPSDVGRLLTLVYVLDATNQQHLYLYRGEVGTPPAAGAAYTAFSGPMLLGRRGNGVPLDNATIYEVATYPSAPTLAQVIACLDHVREHHEMPASLGGAARAHHYSARAHEAPLSRMLYGLGDFAAARYLSAAPGAAIVGHAAGFWIAFSCVFGRYLSALQVLAHASSGNAGWQLRCMTAGQLVFRVGSGTAFVDAPFQAISSREQIARPRLVLCMFDGTAAHLYASAPPTALAGTAGTFTAGGSFEVGQLGGGLAFQHSIFGWAGGQGAGSVLTLAEIQAMFAEFERSGDIVAPEAKTSHQVDLTSALRGHTTTPATLPDLVGTSTITVQGAQRVTAHRMRRAARLPDRASNVAADALTTQGGPEFVTVATEMHNRAARGLTGLSLASYLLGPTGAAGIPGAASGFFVALVIRIDRLAAELHTIAQQVNTGGGAGWRIELTSTNNLRAWMAGPGGQVTSSAYVVTALDLHQPMLVLLHFTGSSLRFQTRRVPTSISDVAGSYSPSSTAALYLSGPSGAFTAGSVFAMQAGNTSTLTQGEILALYERWEQAGTFEPLTGHAEHYWDFTQDIPPTGVLPSTYLDRIGSAHLTRQSAHVSSVGELVGLTNLTAATQRYARAPGIIGTTSGQSFHVVVAFRADAVNAASRFRMLAARYVTSPARAGWDFITTTTNAALAFEVAQGNNTLVSPTSLTLTAGTLYVVHAVVDVPGSLVSVYVNGTLHASAALTGYAAATTAAAWEALGSDSVQAGYYADANTLYSYGGGAASLPTPAEIAAQASGFASSGRLTRIEGKQTSIINLRSDIEAAGGDVPIVAADAVSGEPMRAGTVSRLSLAQHVHRLWPIELRTTFAGGAGFTTAAYYTTAALGGPPGHAAGFSGACLARIDSQAVASSTRWLVGRMQSAGAGTGQGAPGGWGIQTTGTHTTLQAVAVNGAGTVVTASYTLIAADLGKWLAIVFVMDGSKLRLYVRRVEQGSGTTIAGYTPAAWALTLGRYSQEMYPADGCTVAGYSFGTAIWSPSEVLALADEMYATEDVAGVPGKTDTLVSFLREGGATAPATLTDRIGAHPLSVQGAPTLTLDRTHAYAW